MSINLISLPSKPKIIKNEFTHGIFEIDGLYPGYGHTLGNSLRRIILSSISGFAITSIKIDGVKHEFSTLEGVKEDVINMILNLKKIKYSVVNDDSYLLSINVKGPKVVKAEDIKLPSQVSVMNKDEYLFEITSDRSVEVEFVIQKGLGFVDREKLTKEKAEVGSILIDASFTPVRRVSYEVENMRVGDRTDYDRLILNIETNGTISAKDTFEESVQIMMNQLHALLGFRENAILSNNVDAEAADSKEQEETAIDDLKKIIIEDANFSTRTTNTLIAGGIKTIGDLLKMSNDDIVALDGMGAKGIEEIQKYLSQYALTLK
jgi:DNA-directed RNA polymerase subunit alpha